MKLKCVKEVEGLTVNKVYPLLGVAGEYVMVVDDHNENVILCESYFDIVK